MLNEFPTLLLSEANLNVETLLGWGLQKWRFTKVRSISTFEQVPLIWTSIHCSKHCLWRWKCFHLMVDIARHGCVGTYFEDHQVRYEVKAAREIIIRVFNFWLSTSPVFRVKSMLMSFGSFCNGPAEPSLQKKSFVRGSDSQIETHSGVDGLDCQHHSYDRPWHHHHCHHCFSVCFW